MMNETEKEEAPGNRQLWRTQLAIDFSPFVRNREVRKRPELVRAR